MPLLPRYSPLHLRMPEASTIKTVSLALVLIFTSGCASLSAIWNVDESELTGNVAMLQTTLPPEAKLHVLLQEKTPSSGEQKIIAEQTIAVSPGISSIPFSLKFASKAIQEEKSYSIQACVTVDGKLRMVAQPDTSVPDMEAPVPTEITLREYNPSEKVLELTDWIDRDKTALQSGIQANLSGICRATVAEYDPVFVVKASEILSPEWLSGPHHQVREQVTQRGPHYYFDVDSDYGTFSAQGMAMLRRLVREIQAIDRMRETTGTKAFTDSFSEAGLAPFGEFKNLILQPLDTLGGIAKGMATAVESFATGMTHKRSEYEDRYLAALITVSKYKRLYASQLAIDTYTSNPVAQKEMNRIGWAAALGNWGPTVILYPYTGAAKLIYTGFSWSSTLNRLIIEEAPDSLRTHNKTLLTAMAIPEELQTKFLSHPFYSPRHQTIIVGSLETMKDTLGKEQFIRLAIKATSELDAFTFQQFAELLAGFHQTQTPIAKILAHKGIPVGYTQDRELVMIIPADITRWSPFTEKTFREFGSIMPTETPAQRKIFWTTGRTTEKTRKNLALLDIYIKDEVGDILKMMD